eukprot:6212110-Pleurochrysis_carterae.AAC.2
MAAWWTCVHAYMDTHARADVTLCVANAHVSLRLRAHACHANLRGGNACWTVSSHACLNVVRLVRLHSELSLALAVVLNQRSPLTHSRAAWATGTVACVHAERSVAAAEDDSQRWHMLGRIMPRCCVTALDRLELETAVLLLFLCCSSALFTPNCAFAALCCCMERTLAVCALLGDDTRLLAVALPGARMPSDCIKTRSALWCHPSSASPSRSPVPCFCSPQERRLCRAYG